MKIQSLDFLDCLHQPALIIESSTGSLKMINRAFATAIGSTSRKLLRRYKKIEELFPSSHEVLHVCVSEAVKNQQESNSSEFIELINGRHLTFLARAFPFDENTVAILLYDLTVEKKLQEKYSILQRSLSAYTQRMRSDLEFKDYIVDRLPKLLTLELGQASKTLLTVKELFNKRNEQSGLSQVKLIASSLDQMSYISKNISQLRSPYKVEKVPLPLSDVVKHLRAFFRRSFDPTINTTMVKLNLADEGFICHVDITLLCFALRNLFAFQNNKAPGTEKKATLYLKPTLKDSKPLLEFTGAVERIVGKDQDIGISRDLGLELLIANKLIKALGGHISFSKSSVLNFQLTLPGTSDFVLHKKKPSFKRAFFYGGKASMPQGLQDFFDTENLKLNHIHHVDELNESGVLVVASGLLTKSLVEKLTRFNNTSLTVIPIVRYDTYDQILYAMEELSIKAFLLEPLTIDNLREIFFDDSENNDFVIRKKD